MRLGPVDSTPIDDFLAGADRASGGARWEAIGAGIGLVGVVLAVGLVVLLAIVHRGSRTEVRSLLLAAAGAGVLMLVGGAIELAGVAMVLDVGWLDAATDGSSSGGMMRLLGGALVLLGLGDDTVRADADADADAGAGAGAGAGADAQADADGDARTDVEPEDATWRWSVAATSAFGIVGVGLGALSFVFDGHTATEGPRVVHALANVVHVVAGGVWVGGTVGLLVVAARRAGSIGPLLVHFSRVASLALAAVFVAGVAMASMILDGPGDLTGTDWGRRLLVKVTAVGLAALLGAYHHLWAVPRLSDGDAAVERRTGRTLVVEASLLAAVVVMSAVLAQASIA